jgi:rod shape-determining protein MreC
MQQLVRLPASAMDSVGSWLADFGAGIAGANRLKQRTSALEAALAQYKADHAKIATLQKDLAEARSIARLPSYPTFKKVSANVIGYFPEVRRLLLDVGNARMVKPGAPVIGAGGLVGQVVEVSAGTCYVNLVTHADFSVGARVVSGATQEAGIAAGQASDELLLSIYSETATVNAGDLITTSGLSTIYPEGIAIGHITKVWQNKTLGIQEATLGPVVQAGQVRHVVVLIR